LNFKELSDEQMLEYLKTSKDFDGVKLHNLVQMIDKRLENPSFENLNILERISPTTLYPEMMIGLLYFTRNFPWKYSKLRMALVMNVIMYFKEVLDNIYYYELSMKYYIDEFGFNPLLGKIDNVSEQFGEDFDKVPSYECDWKDIGESNLPMDEVVKKYGPVPKKYLKYFKTRS